jgi:hypothetical protein
MEIAGHPQDAAGLRRGSRVLPVLAFALVVLLGAVAGFVVGQRSAARTELVPLPAPGQAQPAKPVAIRSFGPAAAIPALRTTPKPVYVPVRRTPVYRPPVVRSDPAPTPKPDVPITEVQR